MKNIRYAFASVSYHKKISFVIGASSAIFLFLLTSLLNLKYLETSLYDQVSPLINNSDYHLNYQKTMQLYTSLYIVTLILWTILIALFVFISLKIKQQDMLKWRIMGFSNRFVIKQSILESIIPIALGIFTIALFLGVCQHTYEFILIEVRPLLANGIGIKRVALFSSNVLIESTPNQVLNSTAGTHFLSMRINSLPVATIFKAFSKNSMLLLSITTVITLISTYFLSKKSKKVFRM
ncbi:hypothetical protein [Enterococcus caccae]|uniref:ABC3 transporter permease protein domain-containing protein n=1 Tax=Enterococcus caccae ATCC BAA-1240 TaxID=1158612 RepID=R3TSU6_9ENTE|nr:hypothetical protein [Enterococcus caccae]EOL44243.1 hypothetical protein UC7_02287 [Enterococcus caccae ATCC BAA-1240]EOT68641.1 hypothetical protein I580_01024 [Enterococcus caccae ATCC BAA-1240]OJG28143.1 hypothetical protein RU98_GL001391 [Enterococcus caccae]